VEPNKTLHDYASEGDVEGIQRLLKQGKDVNEKVHSEYYLFEKVKVML
jgi:hypothetical protein